MKIGFFTETYYPQTNGVVTSIDATGQELIKRGHEVHIFAPKTDRHEHLGMHVHSVPAIGFKPYPDYKIALPLKLKVPKLDLVHTHGPFSMGNYGIWVSLKQGIPRVSTYHTLLSEYVEYVSKYGQRFTSRIAKSYCEKHYNRYHGVITPSSSIKKLLPKKIQIKTTVIPNGIDTEFLKPVPNAKQKLKLEYEKIYLYFGRVSYEKDIDVIIKAGKDFIKENEVLLIAGKGPALNDLKNLTTQLKMNKKIKFLGYVPENLKPTYYSAADLFITASTSETQGMVVTEAQACGTPVVAADSFALPEMINEGKDGYLFTPDDSKSLARVINYHSFPKSMGKNARENSLKFSLEKSGDKMEKLYKGLVNR